MKINSKYKIGLLICILSISFLGFAIPTKAYNRVAYIEKEAEYLWFFWWLPGWALELHISTTRTWDSSSGHYYFSSHSEGYTPGLGTGLFRWVEYSENVDYIVCPVCHLLIAISYEVHGRFYHKDDSSNYYDITLSIVYDADDSYDPTFGPFIDHLVGDWDFTEDSGIQT